MNTTNKDPGSPGVSIPEELLANAGITPGEDLVIEVMSDGVRVLADRLRKVYVEVTSQCNLDCPMCVRHGWQEPVGHMPVDRFERLVVGLSCVDPGTVTVAFGGPPPRRAYGRKSANPARLGLSSEARFRLDRQPCPASRGDGARDPVGARILGLGVRFELLAATDPSGPH